MASSEPVSTYGANSHRFVPRGEARIALLHIACDRRLICDGNDLGWRKLRGG